MITGSVSIDLRDAPPDVAHRRYLWVDGLTTDTARAFVLRIPTPEQLMPPVVVAELEEMAPKKSDHDIEMDAILERRPGR